jgi:hypothetical protein
MSSRGPTDLEILKMVFTGMKEKYFTFDINGDGTITNEEFRQVLEEMVGEPCPEEDWKEFIGKVDYDGSGTISFEEFLYALFLWFADDEVYFFSLSIHLIDSFRKKRKKTMKKMRWILHSLC